MAFYELEPFGEDMDWLKFAMLCSLIANVNTGKRGKKFKAEDFMPKHFRNKVKQSAAEMKAKMLGIFEWAKAKGLAKKVD